MKAYLFILGSRDQLAQGSSVKLASAAGIATADLVIVDNLAERAVSNDPSLQSLFDAHVEYIAGASRPRAVQALLASSGVDIYAKRIVWKTLPSNEQALKDEYGVPWFPVIDRSRCTGCGTCLDYCLFSVYTTDPQREAPERIRVSAPLNCKTGCPACSRLCPTGALIFPFCAELALNGSVEHPQTRTKEDTLAALGADPHKVLAERRAKKRLIDPEKFQQAEKDRILYSGVL
jgi:ferredoxin